MKALKFVLIIALVLLAMPTLATPSPFNVKSNPILGYDKDNDDPPVITEDFTDPLIIVSNPSSNATWMKFFLWAGSTPGTVETALQEIEMVLIESPEEEAFLIIPVDTINSLYDGEYTWAIVAYDATDGTYQFMKEVFLNFTIDRPGVPTPDNGEELTSVIDFTFPDNGYDWYQVWIGYGADATQPYGYQAIFKWYQADDQSVFGTPGEGICEEGVCTLPAVDVSMVYGGGNESYEWWLTYYSEDAPNVDYQWVKISTFTVNISTDPPPTTLPASISPADDSTVNSIPTEITWDEIPGVLWYQINLGASDASESLYLAWVFAGNLCVEGLCTLDLAAEEITLDDMTTYEMAFEFWGPGGYSMFDDITDNPLTFTIEVGAA